MNSVKDEKGKRKAGLYIGIAVVVLLLVLIGIGVAVLIQLNKKPDVTDDKPSADTSILDRGFVEKSNADDIVDAMTEKVAEGMFECRMSTYWTFPDAKSEAPNSYVANVENNRYTFYFDIVLDGTEEVVYSSPLIPVGSEISNIKLDKELEPGEYTAQVNYVMVDDDYAEVSSVGFIITMEIQD